MPGVSQLEGRSCDRNSAKHTSFGPAIRNDHTGAGIMVKRFRNFNHKMNRGFRCGFLRFKYWFGGKPKAGDHRKIAGCVLWLGCFILFFVRVQFHCAIRAGW
jgi:hypothetical protein